MTGNFKIIMIYSKDKNPKHVWMVHKCNMGTRKFYNYMSVMNETFIMKITKQHLKDLFTSHNTKQAYSTEWRIDDVKRKLDLEEYMALGYKLRHFGFKYNKKTDKLITV